MKPGGLSSNLCAAGPEHAFTQRPAAEPLRKSRDLFQSRRNTGQAPFFRQAWRLDAGSPAGFQVNTVPAEKDGRDGVLMILQQPPADALRHLSIVYVQTA